MVAKAKKFELCWYESTVNGYVSTKVLKIKDGMAQVIVTGKMNKHFAKRELLFVPLFRLFPKYCVHITRLGRIVIELPWVWEEE